MLDVIYKPNIVSMVLFVKKTGQIPLETGFIVLLTVAPVYSREPQLRGLAFFNFTSTFALLSILLHSDGITSWHKSISNI